MKKTAIFMLVLAIAVLNACRKSATDSQPAMATQAAAPIEYPDPPTLNPGISVDDAYAAIPHRRTVWAEEGSTVPAPERDYLKVMFRLEDEAVAARVAGLQKYSRNQFEDSDVDSEFDQLITFARGAVPPPSLIDQNPAARKASGELRAAYEELMSKYPQEGQTNKDAFFDYHCALDFM